MFSFCNATEVEKAAQQTFIRKKHLDVVKKTLYALLLTKTIKPIVTSKVESC
jgi:hypothetical protein